MSSQERFDELLGLRAEDELDAAAEAELTSLLESNAEWQDEAAADLELSNLFAASREVKAPEGLVASALLAADSKPADQALPRKKSGGKRRKKVRKASPGQRLRMLSLAATLLILAGVGGTWWYTERLSESQVTFLQADSAPAAEMKQEVSADAKDAGVALMASDEAIVASAVTEEEASNEMAAAGRAGQIAPEEKADGAPAPSMSASTPASVPAPMAGAPTTFELQLEAEPSTRKKGKDDVAIGDDLSMRARMGTLETGAAKETAATGDTTGNELDRVQSTDESMNTPRTVLRREFEAMGGELIADTPWEVTARALLSGSGEPTRGGQREGQRFLLYQFKDDATAARLRTRADVVVVVGNRLVAVVEWDMLYTSSLPVPEEDSADWRLPARGRKQSDTTDRRVALGLSPGTASGKPDEPVISWSVTDFPSLSTAEAAARTLAIQSQYQFASPEAEIVRMGNTWRLVWPKR